MRKLLFLAVVFLSMVSQICSGDDVSQVHKISPGAAYEKFKTGKVILIDTMPPVVHQKGHILGAINIPYDGPGDLQAIREMDLPFPPDQEILVYCG